MIRKSPRKVLVLIAAMMAAATVVVPQSGRRSKSKPPPPPLVSIPAPPENKSQPQAKLHLLVGIASPSAFEQMRYDIPDIVLSECVRRLAQAKAVSTTASPRRMSRGEAVKAAKSETPAYVVWLEVRNQRAEYGGQISTHSDGYYVVYTIFEPGSAKIKAHGQVQYGVVKAGDVGVSGPPSTRREIYTDYSIKQSARQAADKILEAFEIRLEGWPRLSQNRLR